MQPLDQQVAAALGRVVEQSYPEAALPEITVTVSDRPDLGDLASSVAFALGKAVGRPPLDVANELAEAVAAAAPDLIADAQPARPGFVNLRVANPALLEVVADTEKARAGRRPGDPTDADRLIEGKIVVEHTNINPNKAAHVGHLRNACLGDSVVRLLRHAGHEVEVQNYIDDTGVQVADVVVGLRHLGLEAPADLPFDKFCSKVYVAVQQAYADDPDLLKRRTEVQHAIERGEGELAAYAHEVASRIAVANLATMARVGVSYDLLTWESDILALGFWRQAFNRLQEGGIIRLETEGPHAGCWVLPFGEGTTQVGDVAHTEDKVLVTSQGIATYTAKDIAYQLWKFGLLGLDFAYRPWLPSSQDRPLWSGTRQGGDPSAPPFAHASRVINVIDAKQNYLQQVVYESLRLLGYEAAAAASEHLSYGFVSLSAAAAQELGMDAPEGASVVAMSGRKGLQVLADDLIDRLAERLSERADPATAEAMAAGAVRFYLLRYSNNQAITFDFEEALRTTGETGVYLQYAVVRASSILRKSGATPPITVPPIDLGAEGLALDRALVLKMAQAPRVFAVGAAQRAPQVVAKYGFELATAFSSFYDNTPPLVHEADAATKSWRLALVAAFAATMEQVMSLLGVPVLDKL